MKRFLRLILVAILAIVPTAYAVVRSAGEVADQVIVALRMPDTRALHPLVHPDLLAAHSTSDLILQARRARLNKVGPIDWYRIGVTGDGQLVFFAELQTRDPVEFEMRFALHDSRWKLWSIQSD